MLFDKIPIADLTLENRIVIPLDSGEALHSIDDVHLQDLADTRSHICLLECLEKTRSDGDSPWRVERAHQILDLSHVDGALRSYTRVGLCQKGRGKEFPVDSAE